MARDHAFGSFASSAFRSRNRQGSTTQIVLARKAVEADLAVARGRILHARFLGAARAREVEGSPCVGVDPCVGLYGAELLITRREVPLRQRECRCGAGWRYPNYHVRCRSTGRAGRTQRQVPDVQIGGGPAAIGREGHCRERLGRRMRLPDDKLSVAFAFAASPGPPRDWRAVLAAELGWAPHADSRQVPAAVTTTLHMPTQLSRYRRSQLTLIVLRHAEPGALLRPNRRPTREQAGTARPLGSAGHAASVACLKSSYGRLW